MSDTDEYENDSKNVVMNNHLISNINRKMLLKKEEAEQLVYELDYWEKVLNIEAKAKTDEYDEKGDNYQSKDDKVNHGKMIRWENEDEDNEHLVMMDQLEQELKSNLFPKYGINEKVFDDEMIEELNENLYEGQVMGNVRCQGTDNPEKELFGLLDPGDFEEDPMEGLNLLVKECSLKLKRMHSLCDLKDEVSADE